MSRTHNRPRRIWSPAQRGVLGVLCLVLALLLLAGAGWIAFAYESSSMLYKFGWDKQLLRAGKMVGLVCATLVLLQLVLSARLKILDRIFGLKLLFSVHRLLGPAVAAGIVLHPVLVFLPEDMWFIPLELRYWPEFAGLVLLVSLAGTAVVSTWRGLLGLPFHIWWTGHRVGAVLIVALLAVHVLFVSESFAQGLPRQALFVALSAWGMLYAWVRTRGLRTRRRPLAVTAVERAGRDAHALTVKPLSGSAPEHAPGQFAFVRLQSAALSREEHPFTIASSPLQGNTMQFVIRDCGDWTHQVAGVRPGDRMLLDGPYGLFSHLRCPRAAELVMIAGGIGITPMLSMLRHMADNKDQRPVTLVWSNRTREHVIFPQEFTALQHRLPGLRLFHTVTREKVRDPEPGVLQGRLDRHTLEPVLSDVDRSAPVFVCGPGPMMHAMQMALTGLGFSRRRIYSEKFML